MPAVPANSLIVVTGISGYVASWVGFSALQAGHRVRGTVRSLARAESIKDGYAKKGIDPSRIELVIVDDLLSETQYEAAFQGADGVALVAVPELGTPNYAEATTEALLAALRAAKKISSVKRIVLTSTAVATYSPGTVVDHVLTGEDWNEASVEAYHSATAEFKTTPEYVWLAYAAGKTIAEQEAWKWIEEQKPAFDFASILPFANFGPVIHGEPKSTGAWPIALLKNDTTIANLIPPQWYIDVRDDGALHLLALTTPAAGGQRIWAAAAPYGWNDVLAVLRKNFLSVQVPADDPNWFTSPQKIDSEYGRKLLGGEWISFEQSVVDTAKGAGY